MGKDKGKASARAYVVQTISQQDVVAGTTVECMLLVSNSWAHVLFNTRASHSFIFALLASILRLKFNTLDSVISVGVPLGRDCKLYYGCSSVHVEISGQ